MEDNHVVLYAADTRDFKITTKRLKKLGERVGIPDTIDPRAAQGAVDSDLSGLSEECRNSLSGNQPAVTPEPEQDLSHGSAGDSEADTDDASKESDDEGG